MPSEDLYRATMSVGVDGSSSSAREIYLRLFLLQSAHILLGSSFKSDLRVT